MCVEIGGRHMVLASPELQPSVCSNWDMFKLIDTSTPRDAVAFKNKYSYLHLLLEIWTLKAFLDLNSFPQVLQGNDNPSI